MATINTHTLEHMERVQFFVKTSGGGLKQLPFELVTIDHDASYYFPCSLEYRDSLFRERLGTLRPPVILTRGHVELPFPPAHQSQRGQYGVWQYGGI